MFTYTIEQGAQNFGDEIYTDSAIQCTAQIAGCPKCEGEDLYTATTYNYTYYTLNKDGDYTSSVIEKYKDNGPAKCPRINCNDDPPNWVGGYARCNQYELKNYTYYNSNGKATLHGETLEIVEGFFDGGCNVKKSDTILNSPWIGEGTSYYVGNTTFKQNIVTTTTSVYSRYLPVLNGTKVEFQFKSYEVTVNELKTNRTTTCKSWLSKKAPILKGYKDTAGGLFSPKIVPNFVPTAISITNYNKLIYRYLNNPSPEDFTKHFTDIFKTKQGRDGAVTVEPLNIMYSLGFIGTCNCDGGFVDKNESAYTSSEKEYKQSALQDVDTTTWDPFWKNWPISTLKGTVNSLITEKGTVFLEGGTDYKKGYKTQKTTDYVAKIFNVNIHTLNYEQTYLTVENKFQTFIPTYGRTYTPGPCKDSQCSQTINIYYNKTIQFGYGFYFNFKNFSLFNREFIYGQLRGNNYKEFNEIVSFKDAGTFPAEIGGYNLSICPNVFVPILQYSPTYTFAESSTVNFSAISEITISKSYTTKDVANKIISALSIETYQWDAKPGNKNSYIYNMNNNGGGAGAKYADMLDTSQYVTRIITPGLYKKVPYDGDIEDYLINNPVTLNLDNVTNEFALIPYNNGVWIGGYIGGYYNNKDQFSYTEAAIYPNAYNVLNGDDPQYNSSNINVYGLNTKFCDIAIDIFTAAYNYA
jgi:hypothetical protein